MCAQILKVKLRCKNSSFADNYRYLSYKYNLTNSDWINDLGSLMAKVEIKSHSRINNLDVSTVQLPLVILKKSILLDMHHHKTYMYIIPYLPCDRGWSESQQLNNVT